MPIRSIAFIALLLFLPPSKADDTLPPGARVTIVSAIPRGTESKPIFDIELSYAFDRHSTVWLRGIGLIPGTGELQYTLRASRLVFSDRKNGQPLASVVVKATEIQQTPALGDPYASTALSAGWILDSAPIVAPVASERVFGVLAEGFKQAYGQLVGSTPCRPDDQGCILTRWISITPRSAILQAEMAVMIIYPIGPAKRSPTSMKIYYLTRQAPLGQNEHWDYKVAPPILDIALTKVASLRSYLSNPGGR